MVTEHIMGSTTTPETNSTLSLKILELVKNAQQVHGLRHSDYQRYRGYCTRRIRRLRKVLRLPQGDRRHFKRRDVTEAHLVQLEVRFLQLPLMLAERCWAYAMQLRQEANTEPRKRFHLVQKLRKACSYVLELEDLCKSDVCDARTKLEVQAYVAWMHGTLHFELQLWMRATENLRQAQVIYGKLAEYTDGTQSVYKQRVDEIAPSLRYCAYNIGDEKAVDLLELRSQGVIENFDVLLAQTTQKLSSVAMILHEIEWFQMKIPVTVERVRLFLISIEGLDESLAKAETIQAKIKILEGLFIDLRDVITLVRDTVKTGDKQAQLLLTYLLSIRIERTCERNLLLIRQTRKPQDCVRLLDINVQQLAELLQQDTVRDWTTVQHYYKRELDAYKTLKIYYLGRTYSLQKRWRESVLIFEQASRNAAIITVESFQQELRKAIGNLQRDAELERINAQANFVIDSTGKLDEDVQIPQKLYKLKKALFERLDDFRDDPQLLTKSPNLVQVPPTMQPIAVKPLFYDLALNFVVFPDLTDELEAATGAKQQQQQQNSVGISGFVKGLWGWGKK